MSRLVHVAHSFCGRKTNTAPQYVLRIWENYYRRKEDSDGNEGETHPRKIVSFLTLSFGKPENIAELDHYFILSYMPISTRSGEHILSLLALRGRAYINDASICRLRAMSA